jgi:TPR repeat protein
MSAARASPRICCKARLWYAAAEKSNVKAMHNFAVSESGTQSDKADYALAVKWYREAAS